LLGSVADYQLTVLPAGSTSLLTDSAPDVLLYELPALREDGLHALQSLLDTSPGHLTVFVIGQVDSPGLMRGLMQMGVRDVLHEPLEPDEVREVLNRLLEEKRARFATPATQAIVAAFFNAHGSSGASLLAVNAATALARNHGARVALVDCDLQFGKVAHLLDLKPQSHVLDALRDAHRLDQVFLKALVAEHESGVHVLAAPPRLMPLEVSTGAVHRLIETAAAHYDVVILDLPRVVTEWSLEAMSQCDKILLITQNNLSAVRDTRRLLDYLALHSDLRPNAVEVVNNRAMSRLASTSVEQMKKALGVTRLHRIRNDYAAALSAEDQGIPLYRVAPQSPLTQDADKLAAHIWRLRHPDTPATPVKPSRWFDRLRGSSVPAAPVN
ncbi:MAG: pilus assembly protein CpaE, partial [Moraxellaceae bacterium]|nr:pilus assembly protein CpaE [Moraxellaceae bacterium]